MKELFEVTVRCETAAVHQEKLIHVFEDIGLVAHEDSCLKAKYPNSGAAESIVASHTLESMSPDSFQQLFHCQTSPSPSTRPLITENFVYGNALQILIEA